MRAIWVVMGWDLGGDAARPEGMGCEMSGGVVAGWILGLEGLQGAPGRGLLFLVSCETRSVVLEVFSLSFDKGRSLVGTSVLFVAARYPRIHALIVLEIVESGGVGITRRIPLML